jgi:hypothetical protein
VHCGSRDQLQRVAKAIVHAMATISLLCATRVPMLL